MMEPPPLDPFQGLRKLKNDAAHRQQVVILSAIEEMVRERKQGMGKEAIPTANEYFAAIMTGLEAQDQSHTPELVRLLEMVLSSVDPTVLRAKFTAVSSILVKLLNTNMESELTAFVRDLVLCVGKLLLAQEVSSSAWSSPALLKTFFVLLTCFREKRPKIRKAAWSCTVDLLKLHHGKKVTTLANQVADFARSVLTSCTANDCLPSLHLLGFLQEGLPYLPEARIRKLTENVLRLLSMDNTMLVQASFQTLQALVKSPEAPLSLAFLAEMTDAALDLQPSRQDKDVQVAVLFCQLVAACIVRLKGQDLAKARAVLPRAVLILVGVCETDSAVVHEAACWAMRQAMGVCSTTDDMDDGSIPPAIKDAMTATQKLLEYRFQSSWPVTLPFLGSLFVHFKEEGAPVLKSLLKRLGDLHDAVMTVTPATAKAIIGPVTMAIEGMGMENVLEILPVEGEEDGMATKRLWLLPLLAQHGKRRPAHLHYFQTKILEMARKSNVMVMDTKTSAKVQHMHRQRVLQLWSLLPAFCSNPSDVSTAYAGLAPILVNALSDPRYPELLLTVCQGLQSLVKSVQDSGDAKDMEALSSLSRKFLPVLFTNLDSCAPDDAASAAKIKALSDAISSYAAVAPPAFVSSLFKKLVQKMLEATQGGDKGAVTEEQKAKAVVLCELALALVPSLDDAGTLLLYKVIRPLIRMDGDSTLQKRAYRVLAALCEHKGEALLQPATMQDLIPALTDSLVTCHVSARQMRLRVLSLIVPRYMADTAAAKGDEGGEQSMKLASLVGEVLLCLKDSNAKAREAAYQLLLTMAEAHVQQQGEGEEQDLGAFVQMILAALAAHTPHMRSAAVLALSRLVFEYSSRLEGFRQTVPDLLSTVLLLGDDNAREVVGSVVSFIRVCVAACPPDQLDARLPAVIECLFSSNSKVRFRAKIKILLKKLCRKFGYDRILQLAPETDKKLIHHIQKQAARGERITAREGGGGGGGQKKGFDSLMAWDDEEGDLMHDDDEDDEEEDVEEDSDDDDDDDDGMDHRRRGGAAGPGRGGMMEQQPHGLKKKRKLESSRIVMREGAEGGGVVDLLDQSMIRNLRLGGGKGGGRWQRRDNRMAVDGSDDEGGDDSSDDDVEYNKEGKIVVREEGWQQQPASKAATKRRLADAMDEDDDDDDDDDEGDDGRGNIKMGGRHHGNGGGSNKRSKRADGSSGPAPSGGRRKDGKKKGPGETYKNKKGGGDVMRKGHLEPYAYIPLNPKMKGKEATKAFGGVVGGGGGGGGKRAQKQQQRARKGGRR